MKKSLLSIIMCFIAFGVTAQCDQLFISEYVEGSFNNKAVEIYNPTPNPIDLGAYSVVRFGNGSTVPDNPVILPSVMLQPYETYVIVLDKQDVNGTGFELPVWNGFNVFETDIDPITNEPIIDPCTSEPSLFVQYINDDPTNAYEFGATYEVTHDLQGKADTFACPDFFQSKTMYFNGNDAVVLMSGSSVLFDGSNIIDVIGVIGEDPNNTIGQPAWVDNTGRWITRDATIVRGAEVLEATGLVFDVLGDTIAYSEWDYFCKDDFSNLGFHECECDPYIEQCDYIHTDDWLALKAFYESTNGDNWTYNIGWEQIMSDTPPMVCNFYSANDIYGVFFTSVSGSLRVSGLDLGFNGLTGTIPPEIGDLNNLTDLWLFNNQLSGTIPPELGNLSNLIYLWLSSNQLSGTIPPELGNLSNLTDLNLRLNQLSGIPPELGNLSNLAYLDLYSNQLGGTIPPELGNLSNLTSLWLSYNQFSGCYDANLLNWCSFTNNTFISNGNNFDASWEDFCAHGVGICVGCFSDITVNDVPISPNIYQAQQTITSSGKVVSGSNVMFKAGQLIMLDTDFTVQSGANLSIEIEDCQ